MNATCPPAPDLAAQQLRITAVRPVAAPGARHLQLTLAQWLVAVVQLPGGTAGPGPFAVGAAWPPAAWPPGCVLLGYLDARDTSLF